MRRQNSLVPPLTTSTTTRKVSFHFWGKAAGREDAHFAQNFILIPSEAPEGKCNKQNLKRGTVEKISRLQSTQEDFQSNILFHAWQIGILFSSPNWIENEKVTCHSWWTFFFTFKTAYLAYSRKAISGLWSVRVKKERDNFELGRVPRTTEITSFGNGFPLLWKIQFCRNAVVVYSQKSAKPDGDDQVNGQNVQVILKPHFRSCLSIVRTKFDLVGCRETTTFHQLRKMPGQGLVQCKLYPGQLAVHNGGNDSFSSFLSQTYDAVNKIYIAGYVVSIIFLFVATSIFFFFR